MLINKILSEYYKAEVTLLGQIFGSIVIITVGTNRPLWNAEIIICFAKSINL